MVLPRSPVLRWMLLLALSFLLVEALAYPFKRRTVGPGVEQADLISFAVGGPLFALLAHRLYRALLQGEATGARGDLPPGLRLLALLSFGLFFAGLGAHFAANDIHNLLDREGAASGPVFDLVYFHDELLGHKLNYAGLAGLFAAGAWLQLLRPQGLDPQEARSAWLLAPLLGAGLGFVAVEGQSAAEALAFAAGGALALRWVQARSGEPWSRLPFALVLFGALVAMALFLSAWALRFGGFPEPSKLWGI